MNHRILHVNLACCLILLGWATTLHANSQDKLQFSGFARVVMGYLDDENAEYVGYDNSLSFDQQSLLGLQADYTFNETLSVTGQLVGHTGAQRSSGLEWLYLTYKPSNALQIKMGKQRIPFFNYSDSLDVGFAYPWLTLPQQFYDTAFFSTFEGVLANYEFTANDWIINYEGYWGRYDDKFYLSSGEIDAQVSGLFGVNANVGYKDWTFRASYNQGNTDIELAEVTQLSGLLRSIGFTDSADWLNPSGRIQFYQLSANYENLNYFVRSEIAKMVGETGIVPDIDSFYISAGYNFYPYTVYISYSKRDIFYDHLDNEIPFGVSTELDFLASAYNSVLASFPDDNANGTKIGIRWDWQPNVALKGEMTLVKAGDSISNDFALKDLGNFDGSAILYQLGLEWVF